MSRKNGRSAGAGCVQISAGLAGGPCLLHVTPQNNCIANVDMRGRNCSVSGSGSIYHGRGGHIRPKEVSTTAPVQVSSAVAAALRLAAWPVMKNPHHAALREIDSSST